jgi:hypothetical protein
VNQEETEQERAMREAYAAEHGVTADAVKLTRSDGTTVLPNVEARVAEEPSAPRVPHVRRVLNLYAPNVTMAPTHNPARSTWPRSLRAARKARRKKLLALRRRRGRAVCR